MSKVGPVSWRIFVVRLKSFGFKGPYQEGKHPYMIHDSTTITIPNPHDGEISPDLLIRILRQAGISRSNWMKNQ